MKDDISNRTDKAVKWAKKVGATLAVDLNGCWMNRKAAEGSINQSGKQSVE